MFPRRFLLSSKVGHVGKNSSVVKHNTEIISKNRRSLMTISASVEGGRVDVEDDVEAADGAFLLVCAFREVLDTYRIAGDGK